MIMITNKPHLARSVHKTLFICSLLDTLNNLIITHNCLDDAQLSFFCTPQALEGFAFFLNPEGKVEHVTDNVSQYIKFNKDEILGKSIYSIIHPGDHGRFSSCLLPTSIGNFNQSGSGGSSNQQSKNRPFCCRMLVKDDDVEDSVTDSKERLYEQVQVRSSLL